MKFWDFKNNVCTGLQIVIISLLIAGIWGCNNELNVIEEGATTPIVYGVLSLQDNNHYIRLERSFASQSIAASALAKDTAALYYPNATVQIQNLSTGAIYNLAKVDATAEGFPRKSGPFVVSPNWVYKITNDALNITKSTPYKLIINTGENKTLTSTTSTLINPRLITPSLTTKNLVFDAVYKDINIDWEDDANALLHDIKIKITYEEFNAASPNQSEIKSLLWKLGESHPKSAISFTPNIFFQYLANNIEKRQDVVRQMKDIEFQIDSGGKEILALQDLVNANFGITGSQDLPLYSNISGALGIFTAKNSLKVGGYSIKQGAGLDSLFNGSVTKDLNFRQ
jgi:hypothetical protein